MSTLLKGQSSAASIEKCLDTLCGDVLQSRYLSANVKSKLADLHIQCLIKAASDAGAEEVAPLELAFATQDTYSAYHPYITDDSITQFCKAVEYGTRHPDVVVFMRTCPDVIRSRFELLPRSGPMSGPIRGTSCDVSDAAQIISKLDTVKHWAMDNMANNGLTGWMVEFAIDLPQAAQTHYKEKRIVLNSQSIVLAGDEQWKAWILHETVHAIVGPVRDRSGMIVHHGKEWRRKAAEIGCGADSCPVPLRVAESSARTVIHRRSAMECKRGTSRRLGWTARGRSVAPEVKYERLSDHPIGWEEDEMNYIKNVNPDFEKDSRAASSDQDDETQSETTVTQLPPFSGGQQSSTLDSPRMFSPLNDM